MKGRSILLLFIELSNRGGVEVYCSHLLRAILNHLPQERIDVVVLRGCPQDNREGWDVSPNVRFYCMESASRLFRVIRYVLVLARILFCHKPRVIISGHIDMLKPYWFVRWLFRVPYGVVVYGIDAWTLGGMARRVLLGARTIASISQYTTERVKTQLGSGIPIVRVPPAVDGDVFRIKEADEDLCRKHGAGKNRIILSVCRLAAAEGYKGYDGVIAILPKVLCRIPDIKYLLIGTGDDVERVAGIVKAHKLEDRVCLCGYVPVEQLVDYYNMSDVFVLPSKGEGFGLVFLESLACGTPVVAGDACGARDALLNGELGLLVNPDDDDAIADAIVRVLKEEVPSSLTDSAFLRSRVLEAYGPDEFRIRAEAFFDAMDVGPAISDNIAESRR